MTCSSDGTEQYAVAMQSRPGDLQGITAAQGMGMGMNMAAVGAVVGATPIVSLAEAVVPEELTNDEEYQDIMDDMRDECGKVSSLTALYALSQVLSHSISAEVFRAGVNQKIQAKCNACLVFVLVLVCHITRNAFPLNAAMLWVTEHLLNKRHHTSKSVLGVGGNISRIKTWAKAGACVANVVKLWHCVFGGLFNALALNAPQALKASVEPAQHRL